MLQIEEQYPLKSLNTFGLDVKSDYFIKLNSVSEVKEFIKSPHFKSVPFFILGGGSNILFTDNFKGVVIKPNIQSIEVVTEDTNTVEIRCGSGVEWDTFVEWAVKRNLGGIENLSLIPGTVGASPIQNIGAYGAEVKDTLVTVEGLKIDDNSVVKINNFDCEFGYRSSIFKTRLYNKMIITYVTFRLNKNLVYKTDYSSVLNETKKLGEINLKNIRQAIINIRSDKLPDPAKIGNAGSFFKNPVISTGKALRIKENYPEAVLFKFQSNNYKIAAAFLIEKCGWKGFKDGDAGVHQKQPLVLVNYGKATGMQIFDLARKIQESVLKTFEIELELEVNIVA
jgi:UDP-N-acetylmuramate dehydrogenase